MNKLWDVLGKNGLVLAFLLTGIIMFVSNWVSTRLVNRKIPGSAIAILAGLLLAYAGGRITGGSKGISDIPVLAGFGLMGGAMFRDFAIVSTAFGANFSEMKKTGWVGGLSLVLGILISFTIGAVVALAFGYHDAKSITTIGAGACTFIVGPITGAAVGASSDIIAVSIATGVVKSVVVTIITPPASRFIGLTNPQSAMIYGGLMGTTSGVAAGLAATDPKLVPYGAMTATFYTGLGCLLCPSLLYMITLYFFGA
jgi:malonate transporter MadM subunit